ncbi:tRNA dimethylallyltransferase [Tistlia consotensis]|uniref:tRNA dimethylallyltransferase n=1 Tax=Tistlia consotensis USBA 355 TaxID=560819 RepID=A0A1Y6B9A0_9PROT|nr:tRNA (adenosine(37)-N6)-dimethylallyltransferase MiaA [Tistlia consotensis]SME91336.1 tRNA dimethylallyltransferase [Tistlia consotensis USBA 355]SNR27323.1 tRNA dimethylallyltransferase [Tistlia consotensis]
MTASSDNRAGAPPAAGRPIRPAVIVAGPTASGKSGLALAVAEAFAGTVINADALQVYRELEILTARPGPAELARAPHRLYGVLPAAERCSAGRWRDLALAAMDEAAAAGRLPVLVGGTGLYLKALQQGIAPVPPVPPTVRAAAAARWEALGPAGFRAELLARDPASAKLHPNDRQRQLRAWEVLEATGRPLADWQREDWQREDGQRGAGAVPPWRFCSLVLLPERGPLNAAIDARFAAMVEAGALDEVAALLAQGLDPALPAMKAVGLPELAAHLRGETSLAAAVAAGQTATRRYAKRQITWLRGQMLPDQGVSGKLGQKTTRFVIPSQFSESRIEEIFSNLRRFLLTALQQEA